MNGNQVQIKISVSEQFNNLLRLKAERLGLPVTQLVKYILTKDIEEEIPVYQASDKLEKISEKAIKDLPESKVIEDIDAFFNEA
jgi:hypothetical protein